MKVSFILGAGFSFNAGLPMAKDIWDRLTNPEIEEMTLCLGSSEWKWADLTSGPDLHNGRLSFERVPITLLLKNAIATFQATSPPEEHNYEAFYAWIWEIDDEGEVWQNIKQQTAIEVRDKFPDSDVLQGISLSTKNLLFCLVHLIDDLLWPRKPLQEYSDLYAPYLSLMSNQEHDVRIYTLNHDRIVEKLLDRWWLKYSDGFTIENSPLIDPNDDPVSIFGNSFEERIKLYKLHGSIDQHLYVYANETDKAGEYDYFKTLDYHTKHSAKYVDASGEVRQHHNFYIEPRFITGRNKLVLIKEDYMYTALYEAFKNDLPGSDLLIINGYSYLDPHVNDVIERSRDSIGKIININPGTTFPLEHSNFMNINPLNEAIILD
ncbi:SIR2 family protein [Pontibacter sp. HSC-14F20]|uniref:SIR2 family protein n=1 Tax=Pontibacter sp. HSC-14F20 TaxID=2864136 RepID=UPI001C72BE96|nr:SIR2 family protein [Pontibacter sp. HSC-14F20]MBX0335181.1 SIR2 family protein [Pontibacter sp. HSC-14F20]